MKRFPDQSLINRLLQSMDEKNIQQLKQIHHDIFMQHSNSISSGEEIVVDFDQTGLVANGKSYECANKVFDNQKF